MCLFSSLLEIFENPNRALPDSFIRIASVIVFAFSVASRESLESLRHYIDSYVISREDVVYIAVGTEVYRDDPREVTTEEARSLCENKEHPIHYMEASVVTGENVIGILEYGCKEWINQNPDKLENDNDDKKKKKCIIC